MPAWTDRRILRRAIAAWGHPRRTRPGCSARSTTTADGSTFRTAGSRQRARRRSSRPKSCTRQSHVMHDAPHADGTRRLLVGLAGGGAVESVLMPSHKPDRAAGCVSSQIGCAMGCDFCASTQRGLERNLTSGEIVEQFLHLKASAAARTGRRLIDARLHGHGRADAQPRQRDRRRSAGSPDRRPGGHRAGGTSPSPPSASSPASTGWPTRA